MCILKLGTIPGITTTTPPHEEDWALAVEIEVNTGGGAENVEADSVDQMSVGSYLGEDERI